MARDQALHAHSLDPESTGIEGKNPQTSPRFARSLMDHLLPRLQQPRRLHHRKTSRAAVVRVDSISVNTYKTQYSHAWYTRVRRLPKRYLAGSVATPTIRLSARFATRFATAVGNFTPTIFSSCTVRRRLISASVLLMKDMLLHNRVIAFCRSRKLVDGRHQAVIQDRLANFGLYC